MNLLNEEIRCLQHTINVKRKMMNLNPNQTEKEKLKKDIASLQLLLDEKLDETDYGDYL